jgi:hypothetical protein
MIVLNDEQARLMVRVLQEYMALEITRLNELGSEIARQINSEAARKAAKVEEKPHETK